MSPNISVIPTTWARSMNFSLGGRRRMISAMRNNTWPPSKAGIGREPYDKAGGYGIQGLAGLFIDRIEGSYSGIMGLPVFETGRLLKKFNVI